jgi:predicted component of type VI protein secretion system
MPVTAKLSKRFYEALGEDVANELVDWFNAVDTTYKTDLRDLIEIQAQRFDARLEQRLEETRADVRSEIGQLRGEMRVGFAELRSELLKWMFLFWLGTVGVTLASALMR